MKKVLAILAVLFIFGSSFAFAGDQCTEQNRGDKGQGSTGGDGQGQTTQNRGD